MRAGNRSAAGELAEEHAAMGRRLQIDWSNVDFDDFSLTFIDIVLTHPPLDWYKEYGDRALFGDLGGAGIEISATSNNMAWLRVGLFGGGFGLDLDNRGYAGAFLISLEIPIIDAGVQFKLDASYRVDIPADVLNVVDKIVDGATDVMAGFEAAKAAVLKYVYRFVEIGHHVLDVIDDFLDSMPDEIIEKITGVFPMLAGNTSDVISGIFGLLSNATGFIDLLRESGIIELLDKFVLAVDKVEAVAFNNTFVQGVEEVLEKADELIGGAIGFIGQVVDNGTLADIIDHIGDGVSSVAGFFNASEGALKVIDTIFTVISTAWQVFESFGNDHVARLAPLRRARRGQLPGGDTRAFVGAEDAPTCQAFALFAGGDFDEAMEVPRAAAPPTPPPPPCSRRSRARRRR